MATTNDIVHLERERIYDRICHILTDLENGKCGEAELAEVLRDIQNNWECVITFQEG